MSVPGLALAAGPVPVEIRETAEGWTLLRGGEPYFIRGAVGTGFMEALDAHGANSVRIWRNHAEELAEAERLGMTALISLPLRAERRGMNYDDPVMVREQHEAMLALVRSLKNHPSVLMWALGNELDYVPGQTTYRKSVWDAVNALAEAIQAEDPHHPVMTVVGSGRFGKIRDVVERVPALDLLGVNTYADMETIPGQLAEYGWDKPYVFTEWGVSGYWQVPRTAWGAPYEEHTSLKAVEYRRKYITTVLQNRASCLGSYVFLWGWKQETTHTWFGMVDADGRESEAVDVMHAFWTGRSPANRAPQVEALRVAGTDYLQDLVVAPGAALAAEVAAMDPDGDALEVRWEIRPEAIYADYAGQGEQTPEILSGLIRATDGFSVDFRAPEKPGAYRIYVTLFDGRNHYAAANKPFQVRGDTH